MENQKQFEDRLEKLGYRLRIKDNTIKEYLEIDARIDGKRHHYMRRYNENNKQEAFKQLSEIKKMHTRTNNRLELECQNFFFSK